jgi:shikimate dehydrogenase
VPPGRLVLLGDPVSHSLSPKFQNAALRAAGIDLRYEALRVGMADLARVSEELAQVNGAGNVTVPHKMAFLSLCSKLTPTAERVGAINTFWTDSGELIGDNTDVGGFDAAARAVLGAAPQHLTVALFGAGGAAAAVLGAAEKWASVRVHLYGRRKEQASSLAQRFGDFVSVNSSVASALNGATLVVNATTIGMEGDELPFDLSLLEPGAAVLDLVYRPGGTPLSRAASSAGFRSADGTTMLMEQGALAFERWFGFAPDKNVMRAALG